MKKLPDSVKRTVIQKLNEGLSYRQIANSVNVSFGSVKNIADSNKISAPKCRAGRRCLLNDYDRRAVNRLVRSGAVKSGTDIQKKLKNTHGNRELTKLGFKARRKVKKPLLTKRHHELRLKFAKDHQHWTPEQWANGFWTYESKINLHGPNGIKYIWKKPSKTITSRDVTPTLKFGDGKILFGEVFARLVLEI
ncbi:hypothetical protein QE152_g13829 [Popillia japonica]|uniref:Transposase Tc1-like domain-containing protein n=1 Tax=Popillia japonica TaxID=7064 RepID=A0AAW1L9V8_POPJA